METTSELDSESPSFDSNIPSELLSDVGSAVIIQSRIKYGNKIQMVEAFLMEYAENTSIHGIRYIFERRRPMWERVMWLIIFTVSFVLSCLVIHKLYVKWQQSPVIVGFYETPVPIHSIPFPTITICPETRMEKNIFNFSDIYFKMLISNSSSQELSAIELERLSAALHVCDQDLAMGVVDKFPKDLNTSVIKTLRDMALSKMDSVTACNWNTRFYQCENIFTYAATDDGLCYQFNGLKPEDVYRNKSYAPEVPDDIPIDFNNYTNRGPNEPVLKAQGSWSLEGGFVNQTKHSYPLRVFTASAHNSLSVYMQGLEHNFDYGCRGLRQGYKVFLNTPGDVVVTSTKYFLVRHSRDITIQMYPAYTTTSASVRKFTPERRHCFFNSERYLRFFKHYSESNCEFECLTNFTISKCGCVKFSMPRPDNVRVCSHADIECYSEAQLELERIEILQKIRNPSHESDCKCLPECVSLNYDYDMSESYLNTLGTLHAFKLNYEEIHPDFIWTLLTVHFREQQFTSMQRSELYSISTQIANYGGVLGLFIGSSILSIVELFYFLTLRLKNSLKNRRHSE